MPENRSQEAAARRERAAARRERARTSDGRFGEQPLPDLPTVVSRDAESGEESSSRHQVATEADAESMTSAAAKEMMQALHTAGLCGGVGMGCTVCQSIRRRARYAEAREESAAGHRAAGESPDDLLARLSRDVRARGARLDVHNLDPGKVQLRISDTDGPDGEEPLYEGGVYGSLTEALAWLAADLRDLDDVTDYWPAARSPGTDAEPDPEDDVWYKRSPSAAGPPYARLADGASLPPGKGLPVFGSSVAQDDSRSDRSSTASASEQSAAVAALRAVAEAVRRDPEIWLGRVGSRRGNFSIDAKHGEMAVRLAGGIQFATAVTRIRTILKQHDCSLRIDEKGWITVFGPAG